ncbi:MAG: MFS transporter [Clostridia bacterium]|nr:MFS transporter [Clostridia bacterium]
MLRKFTRAERGWIMYDWANSAFAAIISAIILPNFYSTLTEGNLTAGTWWGYATSIATFICAVLAPFLGTLGDLRGYKKKLFTVFVILGVTATAALGFTARWQVILVLYILGTLGFNGSCVFYDGFLPDVTSDERMDTVSTYGYGLGYIGGSTIPLLIAMALIMFGSKIGIGSVLACQLSFIITAVWWLVFTIPMWKNVHQVHNVEPEGNVAAQTLRRLGVMVKKITRSKGLLLFLLAYFFYIDGVGTIIHMATVFGRNMGLDSNSLIVVLMVVQLVAFPCAILYGKISKKIGVRNMICVGIATYMLVCFVALGLKPLSEMGSTPLLLGFLLLGFLVGTAQGGIQALSRSYYGKLIPAEHANEYFGFFDIFGKFSAVVGPALFSLVWGATQQVYLGIVPVLLMFIIGMVLFLLVPADMKKIGK